MSDYVLTEMETDAIGEISNICLGNSATTLGMLLRMPVDITPPKVSIVEKKEYVQNVSTKKVFVKVRYVQGIEGCSILMLEEHDAKVIADLMIGNDGYGEFANMELSELHISAVSEAMNQMMGAAATSMSLMLEKRTDISTPETKYMEDGEYLAYEFPNDDKFVKVVFQMKVGDIIDSPVVQLYPYNLGKAMSDLFLIKKAKEKQ